MDAKRCDICKRFYLIEQDSDRAEFRNKKLFEIAFLRFDSAAFATFDLCDKCSVKIVEFVYSRGIKI